jgi:hypothetical protein
MSKEGEGLVSGLGIMTGGGTALKAAGAPQFAAQIGSPHVRWRGTGRVVPWP